MSAPTRLPPGRLVAATHNPGKIPELRALFGPMGYEMVTAAELGLPEPEETETTFQGNAELKARAAAMASGLPALADDSGLSVEALGGAPGVYSARWAGLGKDFAAAMQKVEDALQMEAGPDTDPDRRARFVAVLSIAWPDGRVESFEGDVRGRLVWPPRGVRGFGYDPIFVADGCELTFGEMDPEEKYAISHRAAAFSRLKAWLEGA
jgi:XTP/dITP diphosphohydrolase